jgi:hypothetical protein
MLPVYHATFSPLHFNSTKYNQVMSHMQSQGYNFVRVFIDGGSNDRFDGVNGDGSTPLGNKYMDNVADFLRIAAQHKIYTMITFERLPSNHYFNNLVGPKPEWVDDNANNADILAPGFVRAWTVFTAMFAEALKKRLNNDTSAIFAYSIQNEANVVDNALPFSSRNLNITTADGLSYSMADPASRQQCVDANAVNWANQCVKAISSVDPDVMVTLGVFTFNAVGKPGPNGILPHGIDHRHPFRPFSLTKYSNLHYLDIHIYPLASMNDRWNFDIDLQSSEWNNVQFNRMPIFMAEFGAFKHIFPSIQQAASQLVKLQQLSCPKNMSGWAVWTYDTWEQGHFLWTMVDSNDTIGSALSPVYRPNPCK